MRTSSPATPAARSAGANFPNLIVSRPPVARCENAAHEAVGQGRHGHCAPALDTSIRPLASLSREEVAEIARNAADNFLPSSAGNVFEPGTWQHTEFIRAWAHRQRELVEDAA